MDVKTDANVTIGGKLYTLSGYESEEYLQKVAAYLNDKLEKMSEDEDYRKLPMDTRNILLNLNIADDFFKASAEIERLRAVSERSKRELFEMKHELVSVQMKLENVKKQSTKL